MFIKIKTQYISRAGGAIHEFGISIWLQSFPTLLTDTNFPWQKED